MTICWEGDFLWQKLALLKEQKAQTSGLGTTKKKCPGCQFLITAVAGDCSEIAKYGTELIFIWEIKQQEKKNLTLTHISHKWISL